MVNDDAANEGEGIVTQIEPERRERSRIEFPYSDLEAAESIATTILTRSGSSCEIHQLAGWMDQALNSGTFRAKLSAARTFGLI